MPKREYSQAPAELKREAAGSKQIHREAYKKFDGSLSTLLKCSLNEGLRRRRLVLGSGQESCRCLGREWNQCHWLKASH
jgi:hypothetical protein